MVKSIVCHFLLVLLVLPCLSLKLPQRCILPSVVIKQIDGKRTNICEVTNPGSPMVFFIWDVGDRPCMIAYNAISHEYRKWQQATGVKIISISMDDSRNVSLIKSMCAEKKCDLEMYLVNDQKFMNYMGAPTYPCIVVLDAKGEIVWRKNGFRPGDESIIYEAIQKTLSVENNSK